MDEQDSEDDKQFALMKLALTEAQNAVRAYDIKAQIVGVGYIFALNIILRITDKPPDFASANPILVCLFWLIVIVPIILFGLVLYPSRYTSDAEHSDKTGLQHILYFERARHKSAEQYAAAAEAMEWRKEMAFEIASTSDLRGTKRRRFVRGLYATAVSFVVLEAVQLLRSYDLLS